MTDKPSVLRDTDDEARKLARTLLRSARSAALAVLEPGENGFPFVSRALIGIDIDGTPVILISRLSTHTQALALDNRCSLLVGDVGKGDPLAHARMTVQCLAEKVERDDARHPRLRGRFLRRHPKAELYVDFPDFAFFRLTPQRASLNGGCGRAYVLEDATCNMSPEGWARRVVDRYHHWGADRIVAERNFGGDMVRSIIMTADKRASYKEVTASRGKSVRAEPVAALYEQGRVSHVGEFPDLEDQLCNFTASGYIGDKSPDRADAMVWALTELMLGDAGVNWDAFV